MAAKTTVVGRNCKHRTCVLPVLSSLVDCRVGASVRHNRLYVQVLHTIEDD